MSEDRGSRGPDSGQGRESLVAYVPRLKRCFEDQIVPSLSGRFGYSNPLQVPRFEKVVINMGLGRGASDGKFVQAAVEDLAAIAGQKPVITKARIAVAAFKIRQGMSVGAKVTLRRARMYEFLDQLATFVLARIRDFRGLNPSSFDGRGNYALGVREHFIFPTVSYDKGVQNVGMDIVICTTARTDGEARALLEEAGFPFKGSSKGVAAVQMSKDSV